MRLRTSTILLILTILLGILIRWWRIDDFATFRGDQAIELGSTWDILQGRLTLIGIKTSVSEVRNGAVMYYLLAPFLFLTSGHPVAGGILQTLLQLISAMIVYITGRRLASARTGLIAAFFVATSALLVVFSRQTVLAQYPLVFCALTLFVALSLVRRFSLNRSMLLGVLLGISLQVHYSTLSLLIFSLVFPFIFLRRFILKFFSASFIGILIGLTPMLVFEFRHDFFNSRMLIQYLSAISPSETEVTFSIGKYWVQVLSLLIFGGNVAIGTIAFALLVLKRIFQFKRISTIEGISILLIASTFVFTLVFVRSFVPHYAISAFIPFFLVLGVWICALDKRLRLILAVPMIIIFLVVNTPVYGWSQNHGYMMSPGWSQKGVARAARLIYEDVKEKPFNVAMLIDAENQGLPLRYFLSLWGKQPLPTFAYDKAELLYVVVEKDLDIRTVSMYELSAFGTFEITRTWDVQNGVKLHRIERQI